MLLEASVSSLRHTVRVVVRKSRYTAHSSSFADADLACERGRCYIHGLLNADSVSVSGQSMATADEEAAVFERARRLWGNGPHDAIKDKMYYI